MIYNTYNETYFAAAELTEFCINGIIDRSINVSVKIFLVVYLIQVCFEATYWLYCQ